MIRYAKQRDESSCGPVALLNLIKWAGYQASWKEDIGWLREICNNDKGTWTWDFDWAVRQLQEVRVKKVLHCPTLAEIDKQLEIGRVLAISFLHAKGEVQAGHYILCVGKDKTHYEVVNHREKGRALGRVSRKKFKRWLTVSRMEAGAHFFSAIWCIEKGKGDSRHCLGSLLGESRARRRKRKAPLGGGIGRHAGFKNLWAQSP